jgi:hypothetical protein
VCGGAVEISADRIESALGLNYWGFTLTNRSLAFTYATSKAKGENHRADYNQQFSHRGPRLKYQNQYGH